MNTVWDWKFELKVAWYLLGGAVRRPAVVPEVLKSIPLYRYWNRRRADIDPRGFSLVVLEEYRKAGIGTVLLDAWLQFLKRGGGATVLIFTDANGPATPYYLKRGFEFVKAVGLGGKRHNFLTYDLRKMG